MKPFEWDTVKNETLKQERDISFEEVQAAIEKGDMLDLVNHPNKKQYSHQKIFVVNVGGYAYLVPFVEDEKKVFLKTIIPSRKATKKYLIERRK